MIDLDDYEDRFRILKIDPTQKCFSIEREGNIPVPSYSFFGLANFKDEFVFLLTNKGSYRYSLAEDKWEELHKTPFDSLLSACSLGDKAYVLDHKSRTIKVLHNPDDPISSQEMHWQDIKVPGDVLIPHYDPAFAPLNSTEIVIAGGGDRTGKFVGDIVTFNTTTCEFKSEVANRDPFICNNNLSANVCKNTIIAIVNRGDNYEVLKYTKGDTSATIIGKV